MVEAGKPERGPFPKYPLVRHVTKARNHGIILNPFFFLILLTQSSSNASVLSLLNLSPQTLLVPFESSTPLSRTPRGLPIDLSASVLAL
jgi:hypothetical protein